MATGNNSTVEVRVDDIAQLFDTLDPYPFPERDLNRDAEEYIVGWARELSARRPITITIHYPDTVHQKNDFQALKLAMARYFAARAQSIQRDLNELFRFGRYSLTIGAATLLVCLLLARLTMHFLDSPPLNRLVEESFLILGWVANWRPLEIFLYDWWPLARNRDLYLRLAAASIDERPYSPDQTRQRTTATSDRRGIEFGQSRLAASHRKAPRRGAIFLGKS